MAAPPQAGPSRAPGGQAAGADQAAHRGVTRIVTLKTRPEFLAARKGARWACPLFVIEAVKRPIALGDANLPAGPRFGFTVSKQNGNAVLRNRIKRRLRAAVSQLQSRCARPQFDYVLIARRPALDAPFAALLAELAKGLDRVTQDRKPGQRPHQHRTKPPPSSSP